MVEKDHQKPIEDQSVEELIESLKQLKEVHRAAIEKSEAIIEKLTRRLSRNGNIAQQ